jgi:DNA-binding NarL/FixJ family response regulator
MSDRVLIVMDDSFELSSIASALKLHGVNVVGEVVKASSAIAVQNTLHPNILLIDMHYSKENSIAIAQELRRQDSEIGIVILVPCTDLRLLGQAHTDIPNGSMLVFKNSVTSIASLCDVLSKSRLMQSGSSPVWINGNLELSSKVSESMMSKLTNIQIETLRLVADGLTNTEIGRIRFVSEKAVEQIVSRISQVLNVQPDRTKNMRVQLVRQYFKWIGAPIH